MDPNDLILAALAAGTKATTDNTTGDAIKDAHNYLKILVGNKIAGKPAAETAFFEYEADPDVWEKPLRKALVEVQADQEEAIVEAAQRLILLMRPQQGASGKYNIQNTGNIQGIVIGDGQHINQVFGSYDPLAGDPEDIPLPPKPKPKPEP